MVMGIGPVSFGPAFEDDEAAIIRVAPEATCAVSSELTPAFPLLMSLLLLAPSQPDPEVVGCRRRPATSRSSTMLASLEAVYKLCTVYAIPVRDVGAYEMY